MSDLGTPVQWLGDREAWGSPQYIPPSPHNLSQVPLSRNLPKPIADAPPLFALPPQFKVATPEQRASTTQSAATGLVQDVRDSFKYASITTVSLTIGTTSLKFLDAPIGKRNFLGFRNPSTTANIYVDFNSQASSNSWLKLGPGALVLFDNVVSQDDLYVISDTASTPFAYAYSTYPG
jgi:hypothetical protein